MPRNIVILGSTGSIGRQTLEVIRALGDPFRVFGLAARANVELLQSQAREFCPLVVGVGEGAILHANPGTDVLVGEPGLVEMACRPEVDLVVVATAGRGGLAPTLAALRRGKTVALANKETLVMAGPVIKDLLSTGQGSLIPIDSEHSAIWQCLQGEPPSSVERLVLTASGGALRHLPVEALRDVTPAQALRHPTWSMGRKITVDCANLMNKGLEAIEAHWLFDVPFDRIDVLLHPESIVHSLVTFRDSSVKAQLGLPDMRLPIQYALTHPDRAPNVLERLDLAHVGNLSFGPVDLERYPALALALEAGRAGGTAPAVLSAADEIAVDAFLDGRIAFTDIPSVVSKTLELHRSCSSPELADILDSDRWAREMATQLVLSRGFLF